MQMNKYNLMLIDYFILAFTTKTFTNYFGNSTFVEQSDTFHQFKD